MASTPICRCRVLYLGSAVPHVTKDGLHGIQEPLRELYPEDGVSGAKGIDSWLSVWSNGLLLENVDEKRKRVTRFFPIDSLHYCAAVRHVTIPGVQPETGLNGDSNGSTVHQRFLPLDSPFARIPSPNNPPLFACILRRTSGIKVLECHAFVCKKEMAANALVRCCFHAYADNTFVKQLETGNGSVYGVVNNNNNNNNANQNNGNGTVDASVNPIQKVEQWRAYIQSSDHDGQSADNSELVSIYDNSENHKVWTGNLINETHTINTKQNNNEDDDRNSVYPDYASNTLRSNGTLANGSNGVKSGRPRQLTAPSSPPPPPPPLTQILNESNGNNTKSRKNNKNVPPSKQQQHNGHNGNNGYGGPHRYQSSSEFRPMWLAPRFMSTPSLLQSESMYPPHGPPHGSPHGPPHGSPHGPSHGSAHGPPHGAPHGPPHGPPMMPMLMAPGHPPPPIPSGKMKNGGPRHKNGVEEPIYVPVSTRPFKNGGNLYHPGGFPYAEDPGAYYLMSPGPMGGVPPPTPGTPIGGASNSRTPTPTKYKKKKDKSNSDSETKYSTGIYRKKGHLNERAFSYSIRQEHRSRSHSSLATLSFNAESNGQNLSDTESPPPIKNGSDLQIKNGGGVNGHAKKNGTNGHQHTLPNGSKNGGVKGNKTDPGFSSDSSLGRSHSQYALNSNGNGGLHHANGHINGNGKSKSPINTNNNNKKMALKNGGGHHKSELNIRDLHLSDSELNGDYPTLKAKSKQVNKKMAAKNSNNNVKALHNKR